MDGQTNGWLSNKTLLKLGKPGSSHLINSAHFINRLTAGGEGGRSGLFNITDRSIKERSETEGMPISCTSQYS